MCTSPIKILNRAKWLSHDAGQQLFQYVPCGHCVECRQRQQNEWRIRTFYECMDTINTSGYVLFDTLTYAPLWLPRLSDFLTVDHDLDFSCFSSKHIQDFMKRLRTNLSREKIDEKTKQIIHPAYPVKDNLRFFVVSEYGSESRTTRPHYHIFLFVRHGFVPADILSACVAESWSFGRTDGIPYKTRSYVLNHCRFDSLDVATKRCVLYVSKYVSKDFQFSDLVNRRLRLLMDRMYGDDYGFCQWTKEQKEFYFQLVRFVSPFHRQSLHYGDSMLSFQLDNIFEFGMLKFNFNGLPQTLGIFPSLKRKLFYNRRKNEFGDVQWFLNNRGILFRASRFNRNVLDLQQQIDEYNFCHDKPLLFSPSYFLLNHDRLQSSSCEDVQSQLVSSSSVHEWNGLRNYTSVDRDFIHKSVLCKRDFGSKKHGFSLFNKLEQSFDVASMHECSFIDIKDFARYAMYDSDTDFQYTLLLDWLKNRGYYRLKTKRLLDRNKKILKSLNLC